MLNAARGERFVERGWRGGGEFRRGREEKVYLLTLYHSCIVLLSRLHARLPARLLALCLSVCPFRLFFLCCLCACFVFSFFVV